MVLTNMPRYGANEVSKNLVKAHKSFLWLNVQILSRATV